MSDSLPRTVFAIHPTLRALALAALSLAGCSSPVVDLAPPVEGALRVATYNVHYIDLNKSGGSWSVEDWERRKGPLDAAFDALEADVVAFQEMESFSRGSDGGKNLTLDWLIGNNPEYAAAAVGDWRSFPSTQPILYREDTLVIREQGWFFFSETPDVIYSDTFDGSYPAFASWALFEERATGETFRVVNVHFEYKSRSNRRRSAELVVARTAPWIEAGEAVLLAGDLNARRGAEAVEILEGGGFDFAPVEGSTYHFDRGLDLFGAIDHLGAANGIVRVAKPVVLRGKFDDEWPSDHYAVATDYRLGATPLPNDDLP